MSITRYGLPSKSANQEDIFIPNDGDKKITTIILRILCDQDTFEMEENPAQVVIYLLPNALYDGYADQKIMPRENFFCCS